MNARTSDDSLLSVSYEALPYETDPRICYTRYEPAPADEAGGIPPFNLTLILVPGAGHSAAGFDPLAICLAAFGLRCVAVNPRGKGVGEHVSAWGRPLDEATTLDFADDVLAVMDHLSAAAHIHPESFVLLGHSYGGIIARYAAQRRDAAGLVLLQSFMPRQALRVNLAFLATMLPWHPGLAFAPFRRFTALFTTRRRRRITLLGRGASAEDDARAAAQLCPESRRALFDVIGMGMVRKGPRAEARPRTRHALISGGDRDRLVSWRSTRRLARQFERRDGIEATWIRLRGAPHHAFLMDRHLPEVTAAIIQFCAHVLPAGSRVPMGDGRMAPFVEGTAVPIVVVEETAGRE